jgi:hypothetical protein
MAEVISRGGWSSVEFDDESGDFASPSVTMSRLYGEVEFAIEDREQDMADGTIAQAGVGVTATIRSLDINTSNYTAITTATQDLSKMDVRFNSIKDGQSITLHSCSVRYGFEIGAAGDFNRSRVIVNGFAHDIDDLLTVVTGS